MNEMPGNQFFYSDLPNSLPVSEYPEIEIIKESIKFDPNDSLDLIMEKMEGMINNCTQMYPRFEFWADLDLIPHLSKFYAEYSILENGNKKEFLYGKIIPFFKECFLSIVSQFFLAGKMKEFLISSDLHTKHIDSTN